MMGEILYVSTDSEGVEHPPSGAVVWNLPPDTAPTVAADGTTLVLRLPTALLEVLEEMIHRAEPIGSATKGEGGEIAVSSARLVEGTPWNTESATRFALDCAEHVLTEVPEAVLPSGTRLVEIIAGARALLDGAEPGADHRLGFVARLAGLRRLRQHRSEVADFSLAQMFADEVKDLDALDDPAYATSVAVTDAVLGAIEALRHHVLPHPFGTFDDQIVENEEDKSLDREAPMSLPVPPQTTPFGPVMFGGGEGVLRYEPSAVAAREAARHARMAAKGRAGDAGEESERSWQAARLEALLIGH